MARKFKIYKDNVERCWYDSSNVIYTECIDNKDALKTLKVVFSNGTQYQYNEVPVMDYLVFREDASQGKALNRLIKGNKYEYVKLENVDINALNEEYEMLTKKESDDDKRKIMQEKI